MAVYFLSIEGEGRKLAGHLQTMKGSMGINRKKHVHWQILTHSNIQSLVGRKTKIAKQAKPNVSKPPIRNSFWGTIVPSTPAIG